MSCKDIYEDHSVKKALKSLRTSATPKMACISCWWYRRLRASISRLREAFFHQTMKDLLIDSFIAFLDFCPFIRRKWNMRSNNTVNWIEVEGFITEFNGWLVILAHISISHVGIVVGIGRFKRGLDIDLKILPPKYHYQHPPQKANISWTWCLHLKKHITLCHLNIL